MTSNYSFTTLPWQRWPDRSVLAHGTKTRWSSRTKGQHQCGTIMQMSPRNPARPVCRVWWRSLRVDYWRGCQRVAQASKGGAREVGLGGRGTGRQGDSNLHTLQGRPLHWLCYHRKQDPINYTHQHWELRVRYSKCRTGKHWLVM